MACSNVKGSVGCALWVICSDQGNGHRVSLTVVLVVSKWGVSLSDGAPKCGATDQVEAGGGMGGDKNSPEVEQRREKFIEYTTRERQTGEQRRGCLQ